MEIIQATVHQFAPGGHGTGAVLLRHCAHAWWWWCSTLPPESVGSRYATAVLVCLPACLPGTLTPCAGLDLDDYLALFCGYCRGVHDLLVRRAEHVTTIRYRRGFVRRIQGDPCGGCLLPRVYRVLQVSHSHSHTHDTPGTSAATTVPMKLHPTCTASIVPAAKCPRPR